MLNGNVRAIVWNVVSKTTRDSPSLNIFREHIKG